MGWLDIFFPGEARNRRMKDIRLKHEKARRDFEVAYKAGEEKLRDSVSAKSLEESMDDLYKADQKSPLEKRDSDLDWYRQDVIRDLSQNYKRGHLDLITNAVNRMSHGDFFARSFIYQTGERREEVYRGGTTRDGEPRADIDVHASQLTFDPRALLKSAKALVSLAEEAYRGAEHQKVLGAGNPQEQGRYKANLELGKRVYDLLSRTAQYLVKSRQGYRTLSKEQKDALGELDELLTEIKPEKHYKTLGIISLASLLGGLFFSASNLTGNVIVDIPTKTGWSVGVVLLLLGLIFGFAWIKTKKKNKKSVSKKKKR
jgi:hypothetical protein